MKRETHAALRRHSSSRRPLALARPRVGLRRAGLTHQQER